MHFPLFHLADSAIGRVDPLTLSEQVLMELLIEGLDGESKAHFQDASGDFLDITEWPGVETDDIGHISNFSFKTIAKGNIALQFLPKHLISFDTGLLPMGGSIEAKSLPETLEHFSVAESGEFWGTVDFCNLPRSLQYCNLSENSLTGSAELTSLPPELHYLYINSNFFAGSASLDSLPEDLLYLYMQKNAFCGELCLSALPESLMDLDASHNAFSGSLVLDSLPPSLVLLRVRGNRLSGDLRLAEAVDGDDIDFSDNNFTGTAVINFDCHDIVNLCGNSIVTVVDADGEPYSCILTKDGFVETFEMKMG